MELSKFSTTRPCLRIILVRHAQTKKNAKEINSGISEALGESIELTVVGKEMTSALKQELKMFVTGKPMDTTNVVFGECLFYHDGTTASIKTIDEMGIECRGEFDSKCFSRMRKENRGLLTIQPVVIVCSAENIVEMLSQNGIHIRNLCPPILSISMFDLPLEMDLAPVVHCINNTSIYRNVCWWNNSN